MKKINIISNLFVSIAVASCSPKLYKSKIQNTPSISAKRESNFTFSGNHFFPINFNSPMPTNLQTENQHTSMAILKSVNSVTLTINCVK